MFEAMGWMGLGAVVFVVLVVVLIACLAWRDCNMVREEMAQMKREILRTRGGYDSEIRNIYDQIGRIRTDYETRGKTVEWTRNEVARLLAERLNEGKIGKDYVQNVAARLESLEECILSHQGQINVIRFAAVDRDVLHNRLMQMDESTKSALDAVLALGGVVESLNQMAALEKAKERKEAEQFAAIVGGLVAACSAGMVG